MSDELVGMLDPDRNAERPGTDERALVSEIPVLPSAAPPPVAGLTRDVETMSDGVRRITFYSRGPSDEEPT